MTNDELVEVVSKIMEADGTETELSRLIDLVSREVPHPSWTNLIYYNEEELSAEEVVAQALAYKPIQL